MTAGQPERGAADGRSAARARPGVSARAVALGALLIPPNAFWVVRQERVLFGPYPSTISIFANVVLVLFVLTGANALLRRAAPRFAFSQAELLTLYVMLGVSTGLVGLDGVGIVAQTMVHAAWFKETNSWGAFLPGFPEWLVVSDRDILRGHFLGNSTLYRPDVLRAFALPVLAWTGFFTVLLWTANCINVLVRRQWAERERLTFPITWLPIEMTDAQPRTRFWHNPLMWLGFALALGASLWNGLSFLYPQIPPLPIALKDQKPLFTTKPWDAIDWFPTSLYPLAIGLGFLLPLDLLFSCWFFFLFWKSQLVVSNVMAWDTTPDFPFIKEQGFGAIMGLAAFYLYTGRRAYARVWRSAWSAAGKRNTGEALSDRWAVLGALAGTAALIAFGRAVGAAWWLVGAFFCIYLGTIAVVARVRAELGPPVHDFHFMGPDAMIPRVAGSGSLRSGDLAFVTFAFALTRAHRGDTMPVALEGLQMARQRGFEPRRLLAALMVAACLGTLATFWAIEHQAYTLGAAARFNQGVWQGQETFDRTSRWAAGTLDAKPNLDAALAMAVGFAATTVLAVGRMAWFGFPFHPIGYAVSSGWSIHLVWLPLFVAWVLKGLTMRYGGLAAYRRFLPFFLGLILGDCVMGSTWALISLLQGRPMYQFFGS